MPDDVSNDQIALLCDIGERNLSKASEAQRRDLGSLVAGGYIEPRADRPGAFRLTKKGVAFLGERGAGLNEA